MRSPTARTGIARSKSFSDRIARLASIAFGQRKRFFYPAVGAMLTIVSLAASERLVRSQQAENTVPLPLKSEMLLSPFKFMGLPEPKNDVPNIVAGPVLPGSLDGKWTTGFSSSEGAGAVAVQSDGKIVAAGGSGLFGGDSDLALFRYNPDGSLDTSFDGDGKAFTDFGDGGAGASAVAIQADGKIIAAGSGGNGAALVRYNVDGSLDQSFGTGGKVVTTGYGSISEIAVQTDGKLVAAAGDFKIARYNADGSLDAAFGTGGLAATDFGNQFQNTSFDGTNASAAAVVLQADGKIIAAGYAPGDNGFGPFAAARYNADGSLDTSFDGDGRVSTPAAGYFFPSSAFLQPDGKLIVSGGAYGVDMDDFALVRLNADGSLDTSFDGDGKVTTNFEGREYAGDVAIQANGRIVAAGSTNDGSQGDFALSRYNLNGSLDTAFGGDGKLTTAVVEVSAAANAVFVGGNGTAYLAGYTSDGTNDDFAIARVDRFGNSLKKITPIGSSHERANAVASGAPCLAAAGYSNNGSNNDIAVVCYRDDLTICTNPAACGLYFGQGGKVTTDLGGNETATAVAIQGDWKIVVAGQTSVGGGAALVLVRYTHTGALDASFGTGGIVILPAIQNAKAIALQPDGKIIVAGNAPHAVAPFGDNFALGRFLLNGSLDTSFDGDGIAVTRFDHSSQINSVTLQLHGQIVAAGYTRNNSGTLSEFALARYHTNGSLDASFDGDGKVITSFGGRSEANAVRVQRNGRIVAVGVSFGDSAGKDFTVVRYSPNGSLDTTFDTDGKQATDFFGADDTAFAAGIGGDGNIVAAGSAYRGERSDFAVARYVGDAPLRVIRDYDYDADGWADLSVFRPSTGEWYLNRSQLGVSGYTWGNATDKIVPDDYDRDSKTDIAIYRPSEGRWYILNSSTGTYWTSVWGEETDIPVPLDGRVAIFRPSDGNWWINGSFSSPSTINYQFGESGDHPLVGDYDGDQNPDIAVFRPSTGEWYIRRSWTRVIVGYQWGVSTDKVVPADYDGDGRTDVAVYRPSEGTWYILNSGGNPSHTALQFGTANDIPVPADYDGDGRADIAIFRPSDGTWWINRSVAGLVVIEWGQFGDKPVQSAFGN